MNRDMNRDRVKWMKVKKEKLKDKETETCNNSSVQYTEKEAQEMKMKYERLGREQSSEGLRTYRVEI